ncbi:MAG TPA: hypothetical protein VGO27_22650 [Candidatus Acidoferrum sp.]|nr:hypothetical protein [Candidatus Acidoferrum sp.]
MRDEYKKQSPKDEHHNLVQGVHLARTLIQLPKKYHKVEKLTQKIWDSGKLQPQTGIILLSKTHCGAGVATHEIMHAVLWGRARRKNKPQYPIKIGSMNEEEDILRDFTLAVMQFYRWYWRKFPK